VQRRVARTKAALEEAFVALVLERGYDRVAVEDICARADLARATFYAHYPNKEAVLLAVSSRLVEDLMRQIAYPGGPWTVVRRDAIQAVYRHAADHPDLYRACLSDARTRRAYLAILTRYAEQNFTDRLAALHRQARIPVPVMARGFVGAHLAILDAWLAGELHGDIDQLASTALDLLIAGAAWASGVRLDELGYPTGPTGTRDPAPPTAAPPPGPQPPSTSPPGNATAEPP
jgi:AcrR family transcriptional regulator